MVAIPAEGPIPPAPLRSSLRDPAGQVVRHDGRIRRLVFESGLPDYELLKSSGLYDNLVRRGLLVPHEEVRAAGLRVGPDALAVARVLQPQLIPFISYPHEWCFSQLQDAALATLAVQREALRAGMMLKDAPASNIQFLDGRPVLIDTLSLVRASGTAWPAYFQFCKHFLAPLLLAACRDVRLMRLVSHEADGVPLDLAAGLLPRRTWLRPAAALHVHLHARANRRAEQREGKGLPPRIAGDAGASDGQRAIVDSLANGVRRLRWSPPRTVWTQYADERPTYSGEAWNARLGVVSRVLADIEPRVVWDLGAAAGHVSRMATAAGAFTVAFDADPSCVELAYRRARQDREGGLLPLVQDLLCPSCPAGWAEQERAGLAERGPADLVLALGLVHHLAVPGAIPFAEILAYLRKLGRAVLVEFVPSSDPVAVTWSRRFDTSCLNQPAFEAAAAAHFAIAERVPIPGSLRTLYLLRTP